MLLLLATTTPAQEGPDAPASAPTRVSGLVARDAVWSGTVSVLGKVQVLSSCTLTIRPGTRVLFAVPPTRRDADEDRLFVQAGGRLIARGTESAPIVFSSATTGVRWYGIELHSGHGKDALAHCVVRDSRVGIACVATAPTVEDCTFEDNQQGVSLWRQAKPVLRNCSFRRNAVALFVSMQSAPTVTSCAIAGSTEVGIRVEAGSGGLVESTRLSGNKVGIQKRGAGSLRVIRSRFDANAVAVSLDREGAVAEVCGNSFEGNRVGVMATTKAAPRVSGNVFEANETAVHFDGRSKGSVDHNVLRANRLGLRLSRTSSPAVVWNAFTQNDTALLCEYSSYPIIETNNFVGNTTALRAGDNQSFEWSRTIWKGDEWEELAQRYGKNRILARNNYWGEEATREMQAGSVPIDAIADVHTSRDVMAEGKAYPRDEVDYRPFLSAPAPDAGVPAGDRWH